VPERRGAAALAALGLALVAGAIAWLASPLPVPIAVIVVTALVAIGAFAVDRTAMTGAAHLFACLLALGLGHATDQAVDYYRYWAGSARRLGKTDEMLGAYRQLLEIAPGHGSANYYLGHGALDAGDLDRALVHFRRAQAAEPGKARARVGEARVLLRQGDVPGARAVLERALRDAPADLEATQLLRTLDGPTE
jgi:tetratricopeptide (TPR) repeat protein